MPDSTSAAITGSSPGIPRAPAPTAIHAAIFSLGASSPGYAAGDTHVEASADDAPSAIAASMATSNTIPYLPTKPVSAAPDANRGRSLAGRTRAMSIYALNLFDLADNDDYRAYS